MCPDLLSLVFLSQTQDTHVSLSNYVFVGVHPVSLSLSLWAKLAWVL